MEAIIEMFAPKIVLTKDVNLRIVSAPEYNNVHNYPSPSYLVSVLLSVPLL